MGGAARQLEIDAIKDQNNAREEAFMLLLTSVEENKIRVIVRNNLENQFKNRLQKDEEIEKKRQELEMIMGMYKEDNLLEKGRYGWIETYELENRLDILNHFKNKVLKDTGRNYIKPGNESFSDAIAINQLKTIAMKWFSAEDSTEQKKVYEEYLKSEFGIDLYPSLAEINGQWSSSSITLTYFDLGPPPESSVGTGEGCDLNDIDIYNMIKAQLESNMETSMPMTFVLNIGEGGTGTMDII